MYQGRDLYKNEYNTTYAVVRTWDHAVTVEVDDLEVIEQIREYVNRLLSVSGYDKQGR